MEWVREGPRGCGGSSPEMAVTRPPRSPLQDRLEVWLKKKESAPARERSFTTSHDPPLPSGVGLAIRPERPYKHRQRLLAGHPPALTRHHLRHPLQRVQLAVLLSTVLLESLRRPHCHASLIAALLNAHAPAIREDSVYSPFAPHPRSSAGSSCSSFRVVSSSFRKKTLVKRELRYRATKKRQMIVSSGFCARVIYT